MCPRHRDPCRKWHVQALEEVAGARICALREKKKAKFLDRQKTAHVTVVRCMSRSRHHNMFVFRRVFPWCFRSSVLGCFEFHFLAMYDYYWLFRGSLSFVVHLGKRGRAVSEPFFFFVSVRFITDLQTWSPPRQTTKLAQQSVSTVTPAMNKRTTQLFRNGRQRDTFASNADFRVGEPVCTIPTALIHLNSPSHVN